MSVVRRGVAWQGRAAWNQMRSQRAVLALALLGTPFLLAMYAAMGAGAGAYLGESFASGDPETFAGTLELAFLVLAAILVLMSPLPTVQSHLADRQLRALRRLQQLPLRDVEIYSIRMINEFAPIFLFLFPLTAVVVIQLIGAGVPALLALALFPVPWILLFWVMILTRLVTLSAFLLLPRQVTGWRLALLAAVILIPLLARPLGEFLASGEVLDPRISFPPTDWPGHLARWYLGGETLRAGILLAAILLFTAALFVVDFFLYRVVLLRRADLVLARARRSGRRPLFERAMSRLLDRLPRTILSSPLRGPIRKDVLWMLRDPFLALALLVPLVTFALSFAGVEFQVALGESPEMGPLALPGTLIALSVLLALAGILYQVIALPAEGRQLARLLESPSSEAQLFHAKAVSAFTGTAALWLLAYAAPLLYFGAAEMPPWLFLGVLPLLIVSLAALTTILGVAIGSLCPKRDARNPLLSVSIVGLAAHTTLAVLCLITVPASLAAPIFLGAACAVFPVAVLGIWVAIAGFLYTESRRALRRARLRQNV